MGYSKADRRAVIILAVVACMIVAGIVLFGQREQVLVKVVPLPNDFVKRVKFSKPYKSYEPYDPYGPNKAKRPYKPNLSNRPSGAYSSQLPSEYSVPSRPSKFSQPTTIDLNTADTILLQRIPGIGPNIARWIVQHRERLGGFYSVDQLLEVRYVEPSMFEWFTVDTSYVHHVHISEMTFVEMSRHPYIGYNKAKAISNYQRLYGPIANVEQLRATTIFTSEELEKLQNYIF